MPIRLHLIPRRFSPKWGRGKTILEFHKDQVVFAQGDVADAVFYIQSGRVKVVVISEQGKEVVGIFGPDHRYYEGSDARGTLRSTEIFRDVHGLFADPQQPD